MSLFHKIIKTKLIAKFAHKIFSFVKRFHTTLHIKNLKNHLQLKSKTLM